MSPAPVVPVALTVVFALTGLVSLVEYARVVATPRSPAGAVEARAVAVLHVLMSVAMIAMAWGLGGGPGSASGVVQLAVFGAFALAFGVGATLPTASGPEAPARRSRLPRSLHALAALAMVWMVAAMPALMGSTAPAGSAGGHDMAGMDMAGMPGMSGMADMGAASGGAPAAGPAPGWVLGLTGLLVAVLAAAAAVWLVAALRSPARSALAATACPAAPRAAGARRHTSQWACCQVLMSGGMAAMLATML